MAIRSYRENCGICHAITCEHTRAARAIQEAVNQLNQPALGSPPPDPRDAEIARLKAEVEDLIKMVFADGERAGIEPGDLSPSEVLTAMVDALAAHKRALAAGPAALRIDARDGVPWGPYKQLPVEEAVATVEAAQADAMKEGT